MIFKITKRLNQEKPIPILTKAKMLARTIVNIGSNALRGKGVMLDSLKIGVRKSICNKCPQNEVARNRCKLCGCNLKFKQGFSGADCPLGKWPRID